MMTSMVGSTFLTRRRSSSPSSSGILMSMMTTSGRNHSSASSAARPFSAVWMWYAGLRSIRSDSRGPSSSSTTRTRGNVVAGRRCSCAGDRQGYYERELVAGLADTEVAPEGLDEPLAHGGPYVDQALLDHLDGVEQALQLVGLHAGRPGSDEDLDVVAHTLLGVPADRDRHPGLLGGRVVREIPDEVRQRLPELRHVDLDRERRRVARDLELDRLA